MHLLKRQHWVAIALGLLSGPALAATVTCTITPPSSIITEGQTLQLAANCVGGNLDSIDWKMDYIGDGLVGVSVTGVVPLARHASGQDVYYTTPLGLSSAGTGDFRFTVVGVSAGNTVISTEAQVIVQPTSGTTLAYNPANTSNPVAPIAGACGTSSGLSVQNMPTGTAQCSAGKPSLAISGPSSFTWTCLGLNGGTEANCYALRGTMYTVTATDNGSANGSVEPLTQSLSGGQPATVTATPASLYNTSWSSTCGGTPSGNTFTISSVNANCAVTASFAQQQSTYTVTPSAGAGGSISPSTAQTVNANATPSFTVTANAGFTVSGVTGCGGSLTGSTYKTAPVTASCTVSASFTATQQTGGSDPGTGTWWPSADRLIADQSGTDPIVTTTYAPGCLNGANAVNSSSGCAADAVNSVTGFAFGSAKVLGLRYMPKPNAGATLKYFRLFSGDGGQVGQSMKVWLSTSPTATYDSTASVCKTTSATNPLVITGGSYCQITAGVRHYLFMSVDATATNPPTWRYKVDESTADFY